MAKGGGKSLQRASSDKDKKKVSDGGRSLGPEDTGDRCAKCQVEDGVSVVAKCKFVKCQVEDGGAGIGKNNLTEFTGGRISGSVCV